MVSALMRLSRWLGPASVQQPDFTAVCTPNLVIIVRGLNTRGLKRRKQSALAGPSEAHQAVSLLITTCTKYYGSLLQGRWSLSESIGPMP